MTPHYVSVKEDWTVSQVLDHIRTHGQDSETLNVIYVVDDNGLLIDDIRIREFLLTAPTNIVKNLMDRRFVALKATDDQETAVRVFKAEDRSALPVTDTAGALIGIVTVDDVLDVAEREARPRTSSGSADPRRSTNPTWISRSAGWCRSAPAG